MAEQVSDSILLERFVSRREEAAFVGLGQAPWAARGGDLPPRPPQRTRRRRRLPGDLSRPGSQSGRDPLAGIGGGLAVRRRPSTGDERPGRRLAPSSGAKPRSPPWLGRAGSRRRRRRAGCRKSTIPWPTRSSRSNAGTCARCSTTNCSNCPKSTGRRSSCATWRAGPTRRPPSSSAGRRARCRGDWSGRGPCCDGDWSTAGSSLAIGLLGVGLAAFLRLEHRSPRRSRTRIAVRQAMTPLKPLSAGGPTASRASLARIDSRSSLPPICDQIISLARQAAQVATEIEAHDPGKNRDEWREYAVEMRRLGRAACPGHAGKRPVGHAPAARRLDASCLKCHEVFRQMNGPTHDPHGRG